MSQAMLQVLLDPSNDGFEDAWNAFFLDVSKLRTLGSNLSVEAAQQLLAAGQQWKGAAWNTSKASKVLYNLTGVPIVRGGWQEYRNAFLYALSLFLEVEIVELELSDRVADAAFTLAQVFSGTVGTLADEGAGDQGSNPAEGIAFCMYQLLQRLRKRRSSNFHGMNPLESCRLSWPTSEHTPWLETGAWT